MIAEGEDALGLGDLRVLARARRRKSDSAIGVTYSCEKRTSVRAKNASPGFTAGTPSLPVFASTIDVRGEDLLAERHRARGAS